MAAPKKEDNDFLYVRNGRPNKVVFTIDGVRHVLERRGTREDSTSLPASAASDSVISRWLKQGVLEKISRDSFNKLGARMLDEEPRFFLKEQRKKLGTVPMVAAEGDATKSLTAINDAQSKKASSPQLEWAGELMSTAEELENKDFEAEQKNSNYPSRHRDDQDTRPLGY